MNHVDVREVIQWVLIVLAAGFIGQFGKTLAQYVMKRARERAGGRSPAADQEVPHPSTEKPLPSGTADVVEGFMSERAGKKAAKARKKEVKLLKKMFK